MIRSALIILLIVFSGLSSAQDVKLSENNNKKLMSVLGSFSSSNIYLSYLNIDMMSEQIINKQTTPDKTTKILLSINQVITQLDQNLRDLHKLAESNKDASLIYRLIYVTEKMKDDANNLLNYAKDKSEENLNSFKNSHNAVFANLQSLFTPKKK